MNTPPIFPSAQRRTGSALVIVLGMLSVLLLMGVAFSVTMRTERAAAANKRHADMARHILDSALARTMSDLDAQLEGDGDLPVPRHTVVAVSEKIDEDSESTSVNLLSHELVRHLPPDHLAAALVNNDYQSPRAYWRPIYGDVRIHHSDANTQTDEDSPVGRYAYVVLNGCGYLDPNFIGSSNRLFGTAVHEIQLGDEIKNASGLNNGDATETRGTLFGEKVKTGRTGQGVSVDLSDVKDRFGKDNHYATMRDFLRTSVTNALKMAPFDSENASLVSTNSFGIGGFALDEFAPPSGKDGDGFTIRKPKLSLTYRDSSGNVHLKTPGDFTDSQFEAMVEYFHRAFELTRNGSGRNEDGLPSMIGSVSNECVAARNLLEMLDDDIVPGGLKGDSHKIDKINSDYDAYLEALCDKRVPWARLPCVEPVPMLDNIVLVAGTDDNTPGLTITKEADKVEGPGGVATVETNYYATIVVGAVMASPRYAGWNIPKAAKDQEFGYCWLFTDLKDAKWKWGEDDNKDADVFTSEFKKAVNATNNAYKAISANLPKGATVFSTFKVGEEAISGGVGKTRIRRRDLQDVKEVLRLKFKIPDVTSESEAMEVIPSEFGFTIHATGYLYQDDVQDPAKLHNVQHLVQCAPALADGDSWNEPAKTDSKLELYIRFKKKMSEKFTDKANGHEGPHVVAGMYCLDPMFAYNHDSWIATLPVGESDNEPIFQSIMHDDAADSAIDSMLDSDPGVNPLAAYYLRKPWASREVMGKEPFIGGPCDTMWAYKTDADNEDDYRYSSRVFYLDPEDDDPTSPFAFTRVGQLGFIPIGMYRTIALLDGFDGKGGKASRQNVVDYFTMTPSRMDEDKSGTYQEGGETPFRTANLGIRVNLNPPRAVIVDNSGKVPVSKDDGYNLRPIAAALNGCPLREWKDGIEGAGLFVDWDTALAIAGTVGHALDNRPGDEDYDADGADSGNWNEEKTAWGISFLGRRPADEDESIPNLLLQGNRSKDVCCDFDREGVIRNSLNLFTTRQQLFTILLKADSFTPKVGYTDAEHGTSLASVQAIAHVWRDPEPLRNGAGEVILDVNGNPSHSWVLLDMYEF